MDIDLKLKKQVSSDQLNALLDFLKEHKELAKGLIRGRRGKLNTLKLWNLCAKKLNVLKDGATKDGKGWSKYWCDWKYRVRRRALEQKSSKQSKNFSLENSTPLSTLEEEILKLIGPGALDTVVIKLDPLAETDIDEADNIIEKNSHAEYTGTQPKLISGRKRRHTSRDLDDSDNIREISCDRKPELPANIDDSDHNDAKEFLRLEKEKLEYAKKSQESLQTISSEITRLADVMSHIRDVLINNRINV
ncbi:uncharacterized protein LOC113394778 [Vanessa tameamea]|uniref:Uncharacterized protein LOC113394778 n=1 Tax=Vanessa tameamea TaxID=334116 RepID=A0A8B8HWB8_VANTA|nr:uncharacterized protein LOC113394778 [Vanessa tameamea]